jgi:hypothetical protein
LCITYLGQAFQCFSNALAVANAVVRRNVNPAAVRKLKAAAHTLTDRMRDQFSHFSDYHALVAERADAYQHIGVVNFDTMQFSLREQLHPEQAGQGIGFSEFIRLVYTCFASLYLLCNAGCWLSD